MQVACGSVDDDMSMVMRVRVAAMVILTVILMVAVIMFVRMIMRVSMVVL
jgi:hypothetical protein